MLYITTALDIAEADSESLVIQIGETTYYALTADVWAWVIQTTRRLKEKCDRGEITSDRVEEAIRRGREIKARMTPFGEGEMKAALAKKQRLPHGGKTADRSHQPPFPDVAQPGKEGDCYDEVIQAIINRAWDDDPFGEDGGGPQASDSTEPLHPDGGKGAAGVRLRESLIVRLPGTPAVAMDPAAYEELAAWNRRILARQPGGKPADRRKTKPAGGIFGASGSEAD